VGLQDDRCVTNCKTSERTDSGQIEVQSSHSLCKTRKKYRTTYHTHRSRFEVVISRIQVDSVMAGQNCSLGFFFFFVNYELRKMCRKLTLHFNHRSEHLKPEHTEIILLLRRHLRNWSRGPAVSMRRLNRSRCCQCMLCPCRVRNKMFINFWNCKILFVYALYIFLIALFRLHDTKRSLAILHWELGKTNFFVRFLSLCICHFLALKMHLDWCCKTWNNFIYRD
jgi:hypothetical protein